MKILFTVIVFLSFHFLINYQYAYALERPAKEFSLTVEEKQIVIMNSPLKKATVWAFGLKGQENTAPGPTIRVNKGDLVRIKLINTHGRKHSLHIHGNGLRKYAMDGSGDEKNHPGHVQKSDEEYIYEFIAEEAGYYPYHCHVDAAKHIDKGMYGLFVVEDKSRKKTYDREFITFWDEWDLEGDGKYETHTINSRSYPDTENIVVKAGERVRIVLVGMGYELHAPHIHGQVFDIIDKYSGKMLRQDDIIHLITAEAQVIEFTPNEKGKWYFHCHIEPHIGDDDIYPRGMLTYVVVE